MNVNKISFVGAGNMGSSMIRGILSSGLYAPENIIASNTDRIIVDKLREEMGINTTLDNKECVLNSDIVFISVEPNEVGEVLKEIEPSLKSDVLVVSIAAGVTRETLKQSLASHDIVRIMPNINITVGEGMCMICEDNKVNKDKITKLEEILNSFGESIILPEEKMNSFIAISGSSPAYVFMFIEALADGAVSQGMDRETAYKVASQAVLGAAKNVRESGISPAVLKDRVSSPGGTTIQAVRKLEEKGLRSAVIEAVIACVKKAEEMGKKK